MENNINCTNSINISEFEYNHNTLVWDFYRHLLKAYVDIKFNDLDNIDDLIMLLSFSIIDNVNSREINPDTGDLYFDELIHDLEEKILCIVPVLPIGATFASYRCYKIVIHSNEGNHLNFPHVHVISKNGLTTVIDLVKLEIVEGVELVGKEKKKIFNYLDENREILINVYKKIVSGMEIGEIKIDLIL